MKFAYAIKRQRLLIRMTQAEFARSIGVPANTYIAWEQGICLPSFNHLDMLLMKVCVSGESRSRLMTAYTKDKLKRRTPKT